MRFAIKIPRSEADRWGSGSEYQPVIQWEVSCSSLVHDIPCGCEGFIRLIACVGSGDPVRVLRLYTTNTLDEVCSIYCWDICTTCRYRSTCYSTGASGPTVLSVCSRLCLVANCSCWMLLLTAEYCCSRTVLYGAFYSYLCRRYWNGILGPSSPPLPGESFDTCSKAVAFTLADTQVFNWLTCFTFSGEAWVHWEWWGN